MAEFSPKFKEALSLVQKPGRYTGGEPGSVYKDKDKVDVRMAFCFPDTYEIGMSFLGEKILYDILNRHENWWCERAFMPWTDMKEQMERLDIPLYCLESKDPLTDFDIIGFSLEYELCYTNILAMLRLSGIPLRAADRDGSWPLIIAGGPCVCNAEPMADFFDVLQHLLTLTQLHDVEEIRHRLSVADAGAARDNERPAAVTVCSAQRDV